ncbi:TetR/AcrR family transcriptional regulator [Cryobacterium sp. N22]|uniref:TetR/AcrR family transcriptional regulator n=1 Tax=Cryobacterium sp. N22 TaxID=2048290 RepID=UPI000CE47691|nr:TetR/AcrR family transcriptional regulator [Cryobacterium sp. N22]
MSTRETLIEAALTVLEREGSAQFSTRAVCAIANVTAPTLYHHFGNADGLLSAAVEEAFRQFLAAKLAAPAATDPETALRDGWDDYVRFAADRPLIYAAMMARLFQGVEILAARQAFAIVAEQIAALETAGRLRLPSEVAVQLAWASVNAAAMLHVTAALHVSDYLTAPEPGLIEMLRERALRDLCEPIPHCPL